MSEIVHCCCCNFCWQESSLWETLSPMFMETTWELTWRNTWPGKMFEFVLVSINMLAFTRDQKRSCLLRCCINMPVSLLLLLLLLSLSLLLERRCATRWWGGGGWLLKDSLFACSVFSVQASTSTYTNMGKTAEILPCDCCHYKVPIFIGLLSFVQLPCCFRSHNLQCLISVDWIFTFAFVIGYPQQQQQRQQRPVAFAQLC